jgi:ABC-type antimicrobial peptide transport system permease subunit
VHLRRHSYIANSLTPASPITQWLSELMIDFCKIEAEMLAIDGIYRITEDLKSTLRNRAIQAWLQDDVMFIATLDESH